MKRFIWRTKYRKCFSILWIEFFDHFCFAYRSNNSDQNTNKYGSVTQEVYVPVSHEFDVASRSPNILTFNSEEYIINVLNTTCFCCNEPYWELDREKWEDDGSLWGTRDGTYLIGSKQRFNKHSIVVNNNIVLKNVCHNLEALLQGRVSDHPEAYNVMPSMTTSQPYSRPGPSGTNHNMPPMTTSQVYHLPGPSGTNNTRPSMSTSQVNCTSEPLGANTTRSTKTTGKENCEPGTPGTSNTTTSRTASQINQRKRKANQPHVDQSILTQAKQSRGIMGTIMSGIRNTHGTSKNNIW